MKTNNKYQGRMGKRFKSFQTKEVSYDAEKRTITGYAAIFNNIDKAGDMLIRGCFSKSIQERGPESVANDKIIFLWMHNMNEPIGRIDVLKEDEKGLYFEATIDDVERGNQAIKQLESGTLNQFSIGYRYVWEKCEWDEQMECLVVKEVILHELSVVSIGCNGETEYLGLKSDTDYEERYMELDTEINTACKGLDKNKQQEIYRILAKAMALAAVKPEGMVTEPPVPLGGGQGAKGEAKSMFDNLKLK